jgi:actin-related protein
MIRGMPERILRDLQMFSPKSFSYPNYELTSPENRHITSWIGGSMIASIKMFQDLAIKRAEYEENDDNRQLLINRRTL